MSGTILDMVLKDLRIELSEIVQTTGTVFISILQGEIGVKKILTGWVLRLLLVSF